MKHLKDWGPTEYQSEILIWPLLLWLIEFWILPEEFHDHKRFEYFPVFIDSLKKAVLKYAFQLKMLKGILKQK